MKKFPIYVLLIALIVLFAFIATVGFPPDASTIQSEGVLFHSESSSPIEHLSELANEEEFIVSVEVHDPVEATDSLMFNGFALFLVVLNGNNKSTIQLLRVVEGENLSYCLTNYGDLKTEERITVEECLATLNDEEKVVVLIDFPNPSLSKPIVTLSGKKIAVESNSIDTINNASFTVLKAMFNNAEEVLAKSNRLTALLG